MPYKPGRRRTSNVVYDTTPVRCPRCGWRLLDAVPPAITEIQQLQLAVGNPVGEWKPDFCIKCPRCGALITFRKALTTE